MTTHQPDVITMGIHIVDILGYPVPAVPAGQGLALLERIHMTPAGTCAATAVDLAKLGVNVATIGVVGADELGEWLVRRMGEQGVDVSQLHLEASAPTSATMLPIRPNGERPALHVIGANALLSAAHIDWDVVAGARHLHIGGTSLMALLDGEPTAVVLKKARELGLTTSMDLIFSPDRDQEALFGPCYPHLDYFLPNDEDAIAISGTTSPDDAATWFLERGVGAAVITLGADGALYADAAGNRFVTPAIAVDVVDTSGCGDAFSAGLIAGVVEKMSPTDAVQLGVACGSLVATGLGSDAGIIDRAQVDAFASASR
jgi:sugar/nucleoside kinase (ribokinase family)